MKKKKPFNVFFEVKEDIIYEVVDNECVVHDLRNDCIYPSAPEKSWDLVEQLSHDFEILERMKRGWIEGGSDENNV